MVRVASGSTVEMETIDGLDRQIKPEMTATDLLSVEMGPIHPLTGPVYVEGAQAGDLLAIKIEAVNTASRGFTFITPGFGFLREHFPEPHIVHWEMSGGFAYSPDLPGVRIPGAPFMGVMGVAPSHERGSRRSTPARPTCTGAAERCSPMSPRPCRPIQRSPARRSGPSRRT